MSDSPSTQSTQIHCPNCGHRFKAEEALERELTARLEKTYQEKAARQAEELAHQRAQLHQGRTALEQDRQELDVLLAQRLEQERDQIRQQARGEAEQALGQRLQLLEQENARRQAENLALKERELVLMRQEAQLKSEKDQIRLDMEKQLLERQGAMEAKVRADEQERAGLRFREYEKQLEDQKRLIEEMKRRAEQGSTQMQGEVQELALEETLAREFPFDRIDEVPKGTRGADVIQTVIDERQRPCGRIIFESKRTKAFSPDWIDKLKSDQRDQGADLAVIVTQVMPAGMERFGYRDGVWICRFSELPSMVFALREMLLRVNAVRSAEDHKGDKMQMLYEYLTGMEFRQRVEAIVEGFSGLRQELEREKTAMQRIWKSREKQIEKIIHNTIDMYGAVKGIAGSSVQSIPALELSPPDEDSAD